MTNDRSFTLSVLPEKYRILKFPPDSPMPAWAEAGEFFSVTRTSEELSIVTACKNVPAEVKVSGKWRALKVHGPFALDEVGVFALLAVPLASAGISIFVISTYDTDYLLVNAEQCDAAVSVLRNAGHRVKPD
jgi:uncharacterized protein